MNIIKNNTKLSVIFLGLLLLFLPVINSQTQIYKDISGTPLIQKFPFPDFFLTTGKFSVYEDSSGTFLIGARNKLIMFYGNEFISIPLKGQINISSNLRSVFYTGYNSLGLVRLFKNSQPQLIPVIDEKLGNSCNIGQIGKVFVSGGLMVFCNENKLFAFDGTSISTMDSSSIGIQLFNINDSIYVQKVEKGLFKFENGRLKALPYGAFFANRTIESIFSFGKQFLVKCNDSPSFYSIDSKDVKKLTFGFEEYLEKAGFSDAKVLYGSRIAISSKSAGLLIYNFLNNTIQNIGVDEGLLANTVKNLYCDKAGNLWVFHDNGISRIELNIPASTYGQNSGITGSVNDIVKYNNILYVATSNGLFKGVYRNISGASEFSRLHFTSVEDILSESHKLFIQNNKLYVATPNGIYWVENGKASIVYKNDISDIIQNPNHKSEYLIANETGLQLISIEGSKSNVLIKSGFQNNSPIELVPENDSTVWIRSAENKLFTLALNNSKLLDNVKEINFKNANGKTNESNFYLLATSKGVRFCFPDSILRYNKLKGIFEHDELKDVKQLQGLPWLVEIMTDKSSNKWLHVSSSLQNLRGVLLYKNAAKGIFEKPVFFNTGSTNSPIFVDSDYIWIGGENKLIQFNNKRPFFSYRNFSAIIKRIKIGKDSLLRIGLDEPEISYKYRSILFDVSSTCFEGEPNVLYQYNLKGLSNNWTPWTKRSSVLYRDLSPGQYTFKVKVLNVDGTVSAITDLDFYVLKPFYLTYWAYAIYILFFLFIVFILLRWRMWLFLRGKEKLERIVLDRTEEIMKEKEKSEILIANMLPKGTADELKSTGKATSQKFAMATVLFSDIQGFTKIAEQMNPELLIDELDAFFFHFDMVVEKYNIEKIKTIGDAYMCAGGIPRKNITNPVEVVLAALEMQDYMHQLKLKNADIWDLRIGIHTGAVIAGVVGHKKFSYDIWGDTVNTASRMESSGEPGKVNISGHTYELVKDFFICEHRGKMPVKYKGEIDMYFVQGIRPELTIEAQREPNKKFFILLQLLRIQDLEDIVIEKLEKDLPPNLHFHNITRIKEVLNLVELFGKAEGLNEEENLLVRTAALMHDVGFTTEYDNHEDSSINISRELLPDYAYTVDQIEKVIALIESTKRNRKPQNIMEEILLDADMNYLSRADFVTLNENLFLELHEKGKVSSKEEWTKMQIVLLSNHKYYTKVANLLRDVSPEQQIENLLEFSQKNNLP